MMVKSEIERENGNYGMMMRGQLLRKIMGNLQEVIFGTKLAVLFPAIPLAIAADTYHFGRVCFFFHLLNTLIYTHSY